jgi:hypothetical protein
MEVAMTRDLLSRGRRVLTEIDDGPALASIDSVSHLA